MVNGNLLRMKSIAFPEAVHYQAAADLQIRLGSRRVCRSDSSVRAAADSEHGLIILFYITKRLVFSGGIRDHGSVIQCFVKNLIHHKAVGPDGLNFA